MPAAGRTDIRKIKGLGQMLSQLLGPNIIPQALGQILSQRVGPSVVQGSWGKCCPKGIGPNVVRKALDQKDALAKSKESRNNAL